MRKLILAATALVAPLACAHAGNFIDLDDSGGKVGSLTINQDSVNTTNVISGDGTASHGAPGPNGAPVGASPPFKINGTWTGSGGITINQYGGSNVLSGAISATSGSTSAFLNASYGTAALSGPPTVAAAGGNNQQSLTIGNINAPTNPQITIVVVNDAPIATYSAANMNTINDVINVSGGGSLTYALTLYGDSTKVNNTVTAAGNTTISETIGSSGTPVTSNAITANTLNSSVGGSTVGYWLNVTGTNNTISNTIYTSGNIALGSSGTAETISGGFNTITDAIGAASGRALSYTESLSMSGSSNTITNNYTGAGGAAETVSLNVSGSNDVITNNLSATTGTQASYVNADVNTHNTNYTLNASAANTAASVTLENVTGSAGVTVNQSGAGSTAYLTVNATGQSYTLGAGGVSLTQTTAGSFYNGTVTPTGAGFTQTITQ